MEEIIKQIAQIDSVAVSNRQNSERALQEKRKAYEEQMETYRQKTLQTAHQKADEIYRQIIQSGEKGSYVESEKSRRSAVVMQNYYAEIKETLLNEVFHELFEVEG